MGRLEGCGKDHQATLNAPRGAYPFCIDADNGDYHSVSHVEIVSDKAINEMVRRLDQPPRWDDLENSHGGSSHGRISYARKHFEFKELGHGNNRDTHNRRGS